MRRSECKIDWLDTKGNFQETYYTRKFDQIVRYSTQDINQSTKSFYDNKELKRFIKILVFLSKHLLSGEWDYWLLEENLEIELIKKKMSRNIWK